MSIADDIQAVEAKIKAEVVLIEGKVSEIVSGLQPLVQETEADLVAAAKPILEAAWAEVLAFIAAKISGQQTPSNP
jgi:hypothetical protein